MKLLINIGHPAHVHFFKNAIKKFESKGYQIKVTAREKDNSLYLLNNYGIKHEIVGQSKSRISNKIIEVINRELNIYNIAKKFDPDILIGASGDFFIATIGWLLRKPSIIFEDSEADKSIYWLCEPFATKIFTPTGFTKHLNPKKHIRYNGYKELAYLHPKYFTPNDSFFHLLGLKPYEKYVIIRLVAWNAVHDIGQKGLTKEAINNFIKLCEKYGQVFISSESELPQDLKKYQIKIPPERIHDALFFAQMLIGDSQTMTTEAGILGTPAIRSNSFVGTMSNFEELEKKYDLIFSFNDPNRAFNKAKELLEDNNLKKKWENKRKILLNEKINVTDYLVNCIEHIKLK
jgi:predicted glycosyltransferase